MRFLALMVTLAAAAPCSGQQAAPPCKVYFKVIQSDSNIPGGKMERVSDSQKKWLRDKAPKKYPGVCYDPTKATYAIVWSQEEYTGTVSDSERVPITDSNGNRVGSTTTHSTRETTRFVTYASVMKISAEGKLQEPPLFFDKDLAHFFRWSHTSSSSSVSGLEQGVKFLSTLAK